MAQVLRCLFLRFVFPLSVCAVLALSQTTGNTTPGALQLLQSGRADEALRALQIRIQNNPGDAEAWSLQGRVYFQLRRWDEAIRSAEKAVQLSPSSSLYHLWLGRAYGEKADSIGSLGAFSLVRKVKAEFERAVALDTKVENLPARADLAEFYVEAPGVMGGDKTMARNLVEFVMKYDAALGHAMAANLAKERKKLDQAEQEYKAAIEASGNAAHYWVMLASFYRKTGRLNDMEAAINQSLKAEMRDGIALFDGAAVLLRSGRNFPVAIDMLRRYLKLENQSEEGPAFEAHFMLGQLLEQQGDRQAAAQEYRAALALASQFQRARDALARVSR